MFLIFFMLPHACDVTCDPKGEMARPETFIMARPSLRDSRPHTMSGHMVSKARNLYNGERGAEPPRPKVSYDEGTHSSKGS